LSTAVFPSESWGDSMCKGDAAGLRSLLDALLDAQPWPNLLLLHRLGIEPHYCSMDLLRTFAVDVLPRLPDHQCSPVMDAIACDVYAVVSTSLCPSVHCTCALLSFPRDKLATSASAVIDGILNRATAAFSVACEDVLVLKQYFSSDPSVNVFGEALRLCDSLYLDSNTVFHPVGAFAVPRPGYKLACFLAAM
jgi:hypothetical protein